MDGDLPHVPPGFFWTATIVADAFSVAVAVGVVLLFFYPCCGTTGDTDDEAAAVEVTDTEASPVGSLAETVPATNPHTGEGLGCWWEVPHVLVQRTPPPP